MTDFARIAPLSMSSTSLSAMSHLRFSRAILSRECVTLSREKVTLSATVKLHAATLSHKQTKQNGL